MQNDIATKPYTVEPRNNGRRNSNIGTASERTLNMVHTHTN